MGSEDLLEDIDREPDTLELAQIGEVDPSDAEDEIKAVAAEHFEDAGKIYLRDIQKHKRLSGRLWKRSGLLWRRKAPLRLRAYRHIQKNAMNR